MKTTQHPDIEVHYNESQIFQTFRGRTRSRSLLAVMESSLDLNEADDYGKLFAAAPELLEACELSLANADGLIYRMPAAMEDSVELKALRTWRDKLKAAISKATGDAR